MTRRHAAALVAIVAVAFVLRAWGVRFGLPATYHPDEHQYVDAAVAAVGGAFNPGRFNNPSLLKYALAGVYAGWYALGRLAGAWPSVAAWQAAVAADPTTAYVLARGLVAALGAATCLVVAAIGRRLRDRVTGLVAAALLAVAFLHVRDSHYAVSDVPAALLTTLAVAVALRVRATGRGRDLVLGGLCVGLAAATKYTALVAVLPLGIAWLAAGEAERGFDTRRLARRLFSRPVALAGLALVAAFLAAVPYAALDWPAFSADVALLATRGREGFKGLRIDPAPGWIFYLKSLSWGLGRPMLLAAVAGLALAARRRRADDVIVGVLPVVLWAYLGGQLNMFARFMIPAVPLLCVWAADAVVAAGGEIGRWTGRRRDGERSSDGWGEEDRGVGGDRATRSRRPYAGGVAAIVGAVIAAPSLVAAGRHDVLLGRADTRALAREWIVEHVPAGAKIVLQAGGPELDGLGYDVESVGTLELPERPLDDWIDDATDHGRRPAWLVTSSFSTRRRLLDPARDAQVQAWYEDMWRRLDSAASFQAYNTYPVFATQCCEGWPPPPFVFDQVYGPCTDLWRFERPGPFVSIYPLR